MSHAAVPARVAERVPQADCPPGHRFNLYFPIWREDWSLDKNRKHQAVAACTELPPSAKELLAALGARQLALAEALGAEIFEAASLAPFATGLGNAHPVENGFAFLTPYGLPYLAGSGAKGVFRVAAQELCCGDDPPLAFSDVDILFGPENTKDAERGALCFWDVFPQCSAMSVEIMTPHHGGYYQDSGTPNDAGQPIPIPFLAVPHGAQFRFIVQCDEARLPEPLRLRWRELVTAIFKYACDWRGFGAKTAVGYGALAPLSAAEQQLAAAERRKCPWVDQKLDEIAKQNHSSQDDALRGRALAEAWQGITDPALKTSALEDIRRRLHAKGWWDNPPGKAARLAKGIYEAIL